MNTILQQILKKTIANRISSRPVAQDTKLIERYKNRAEELKVKAEEGITTILLNLNMNVKNKFQRSGLKNSHTLLSATISPMITKRTFSKQKIKSYKGEKEGKLNKVRLM
jgi:hypothetical protein